MGKKVRLFVEKHKKACMMGASAVGTTLATVVPAFAAGEADLSGVAITTEMLTPVVTGTTANIAVILPVGIALFAIMIGVGLIPAIIKKFVRV